MSGVFDFFEKIHKQILDLQNTVSRFQQSWDKFQKFWDLFFTLVPWEVLLLLLFSVILLSLFNSVSPSTPKLNLTFAIMILSGIWVYLWGIFSKEVGYGKVLISSLYILLPLHLINLSSLGYQFFRKKHLAKNRVNPRTREEALNQISRDFNNLMATAYEKNDTIHEFGPELNSKITDVERSLEGFRKLFPE